MGFKSDIEIAQGIQPWSRLQTLQRKQVLMTNIWNSTESTKQKNRLQLIKKESDAPNGKLILVTAINPTPAGRRKDNNNRWSGRRYAKNWQKGYGCSS